QDHRDDGGDRGRGPAPGHVGPRRGARERRLGDRRQRQDHPGHQGPAGDIGLRCRLIGLGRRPRPMGRPPKGSDEGGGTMDKTTVNGVELEYEVTGSGEPVLLISPALADGFVPLVEEGPLADRYQLIRYHKRGWVGSTHPDGAVSVEEHAEDAAALL